MRRSIPYLIAFTILSIAAAYIWFFIWNPAPPSVVETKAISIDAVTLFNAFSQNEKKANADYLDKVLEVRGEVTNITTNADGLPVILLKTDDMMFGINCTMEEKNTSVKTGDQVTLKGLCTGYLTDVVLIRCHIKN
ncbi:MAG: OB-fold protein [Lacibacter sp.]